MERINHHNYETWLMLYLDNELPASERQAVEAFMEANPEIKDEFNGLKEVILTAEPLVSMPGKERLLMPEIWNEDAISLQQEQLLLLADNALPEAQRVVLEKEISESSLLQREWGLLQKTVIGKEIPATMPGKENLYRHERTRVIPFNKVFRIAAAAAVIGFGIFFALKLQQKTAIQPQDEVVIQDPVLPSAPNQLLPEETVLPDQKENPANQSETKKDEKKVPAQNVLTNSVLKNTEDYASNRNAHSLPETILEPTKKEPVELLNNTTTIQTQPVEIGIAGVDATVPMQAIAQPEIATGKSMPESAKNPISVEAFEQNDFEEEEAETINIAGAKISKQRVRGIYRSITRPLAKTFEKNGAKTYETK